MAAAQLTDEELFSELKRLGFIPGPVTENTRPVYLKKLKKLREDQQQRGSRASKGRNSGTTTTNNNNSSGGGSAAGASGSGARPPGGDVTHLDASKSPGGRPVLGEKRHGAPGKVVLGFSSDESDVEISQKKRGLYGSRRERASVHQHQQPGPNVTPAARRSKGLGAGSSSPLGLLEERRSTMGSPWWGDRAKLHPPGAEGRGYAESSNSDYRNDVNRESRTVNGSRSPFTPSSGKFAGGYSDSEEEDDEEEEEEDASELGRYRDRRLSSRRSHPKSPPPFPEGARGAESDREKARGGVIRADDKPGTAGLDIGGDQGEEEDEARRRGQGGKLGSGFLRNRGFPLHADLVSGIMGEFGGGSSSGPTSYNNNHVNCGSDDGVGGFGAGLRSRYSAYSSLPATYRLNHSNHAAPNHSYGQASRKPKLPVPEDELLQQFRREEVSASGGFSAHYLSMILLTAACLFFVLLGLMYLRMRGSGVTDVDAVTKNHPFGIEFDNSYADEQKDVILKLLLHLHDHLAKIAGEHDCGDHTQHLNRNISYTEAFEYLMLHSPEYEDFWDTAMEWLIRSGEDVGIRLIGSHPEESVTNVSQIMCLESTHPRMSFICRFRRAFFTVIYRLLLFIAGVGVMCGLLYYMKYRWRKEEEDTRQMYDMVERIIDVLRSHSEACLENKDLQPYLPIPHVRDSLIQPQDRKKMKKVWERAVKFLSTNESRIRTETQRIKGEDFLVWRWTQPSLSCDKMSTIPPKVWQGKAFPLDRRNSPPNSLTPCLKIRNMFDPVMEVGENWHLAIQEAILEKCSDNDGIVHIAVDKNSREGCVYVKCLSAEHSGKAFKALHGSWFDGKLVTVKYLRLDRYHQRFPQALACNTPLKPSSMHMSTLSHLRLRSSPASSPGFS
ncbi:inner nuclear membrane protein Man1 [Brienomyrus brachyistius]|uniref:inner nuclear membrane protein Man1 n=1 Tax=Brienomyrus brachyistius TaxID=42636 RepID=UPI0020B2E7EA|nr:inner nuclear membrane protein Man1 [Brienomyrus brachyistius]